MFPFNTVLNNHRLTSQPTTNGLIALPTALTQTPLLLTNNSSTNSTINKDSQWLTLEVCREYQRNLCPRTENDCKYAHPPLNLEIQNGRIMCCYDSIKGNCHRIKPPCKYYHPPQHLKEVLVQNGKNNLLMKNLQMNLAHQQHLSLAAVAASVNGNRVNPAGVVVPSVIRTTPVSLCTSPEIGQIKLSTTPSTSPLSVMSQGVITSTPTVTLSSQNNNNTYPTSTQCCTVALDDKLHTISVQSVISNKSSNLSSHSPIISSQNNSTNEHANILSLANNRKRVIDYTNLNHLIGYNQQQQNPSNTDEDSCPAKRIILNNNITITTPTTIAEQNLTAANFLFANHNRSNLLLANQYHQPVTSLHSTQPPPPTVQPNCTSAITHPLLFGLSLPTAAAAPHTGLMPTSHLTNSNPFILQNGGLFAPNQNAAFSLAQQQQNQLLWNGLIGRSIADFTTFH